MISLKTAEAQCLFYNASSDSCNFCSYNYFDLNAYDHYLRNSAIKSSDCSLKLSISIERHVLITNQPLNSLNSLYFDQIYYNIIDAFMNESIISSNYYQNNITFSLSKGHHFILNSSFKGKNNFFFRRLKANLLIKPLYCSELNINGLCNNGETPNIYIKSLLFTVIVSGKLNINNLHFDAIDANYKSFSNNSCLNDNNTVCCDQPSLINYTNPCFIQNSNFFFTGENNYYGLFQLESIYDDPLFVMPELKITNITFTNLYAIRSAYTLFLSLISIDWFGGNLFINNITINQAYFENSIINYNDTYSMEKNIYNFNNFNIFVSLYNNNAINYYSPQEINVQGMNIMNFHLFGLEQNINSMNNGLILLRNYKGNFYMNCSKFSNITLNLNFSLILIEKLNFLNILDQLYLGNLINLRFIYGNLINITLINITMYNSSWNDNCSFFQDSNVLISNFVLNQSSSYIRLLTKIFLFGYNLQLSLNNTIFVNLTSLSFKFINSYIIISNSSFINLNMLTSQFMFQNTSLISLNNQWNQITQFNYLFKFISCPQLKILSNNVTNLDGSYFISGTSLSNVLIYNTNFINLTHFNYLLDKATVFLMVTLDNSYFINFTLNNAFIYSVTQLNFLLSECFFINISLIYKKSTNLICVQIGQEIIQNSYFENIIFQAGGTAVINFKVSNVVVKNSQFINCGFGYPINIANFSSIEYVNIFYVWTCAVVVFTNNSFMNKGAINLFSGFIHCTLTTVSVVLDGNIFRYSNKTINTYYTGLIFSNAPRITFKNNKFHNFNCPNYPSFIHNNGAVTLQGDNTYSQLYNKKTAILINNSFFGCQCQKGGSLGIINYDYLYVEQLYIYNSSSSIAGGLLVVSSSKADFEQIFFNYTYALQGYSVFLKNIVDITFKSYKIYNGYSLSNGGIKVRNVESLKINYMNVFNVTTLGSGGVFNLQFGETDIENSVFTLCNAGQAGGIGYLTDEGNLTLFNISAFLTNSQMGGSFYVDFAYKTIINQCIFMQTKSSLQGAAVLIDLIQNFQLDSSNFTMCESSKNGILFLKNIENNADYLISNLICLENIANAGSCIFSEAQGYFSLIYFTIQSNQNNCLYFVSTANMLVSLSQGNISETNSNKNVLYANNIDLSISHIIFQENLMMEGIIYVENLINMLIYDINFIKNKDIDTSVKTPLINCFSTTLLVDSLNFQQTVEKLYFAHLISSKQCNVTLSSSIINQQNHDSEAFISMEAGSLVLNYMNFSETQGPIITLIDANVKINNTVFSRNIKDSSSYVSDILISNHFFDDLMVSIVNSIFYSTDGLSTLINNARTIVYKNCDFNGFFHGQGIKIIDTPYVSINDSNFMNFLNISEGGASIWISSIKNEFSYYSIFNSSFISNTACFASSIFLQGLYNFTLKNCFFSNNSALQFIDSSLCGIGGVGLFHCSSDLSCYFELTDNKFENNYAAYVAPTIFSKSYLIEQNNMFFNNYDNLNFTTKFASFPLNVKLSTNQTIIASGGPAPLTFYLQDFFNQTFFLFKPSSAILIEIIDLPDLFLKNTLNLAKNIGIYNFSQLIIIKRPDTYFNIEMRLSIYDEISSTGNVLSQTFQIYSRPCKIGELLSLDLQCQMCNINYFSLIDPMIYQDIHKCSKCVENAYCPGGSYLIPLSEYWRFSSNSTKIIKCLLGDACLGPPNIPFNQLFLHYDNYSTQYDFIHGVCAEGHEDHLCFKCMQGYGRTTSNSLCSKCKEIEAWAYVRLTITFLVVILYSMINARALVEVEDNDASNIIGVVSKICINHLQKVSIINLFNFNAITMDLDNFFNFLNVLTFLNENAFVNECFLQKFFQDSENFYIYKVFFSFMAPIIASFLCLFILVLFEIRIIYKKNKANLNTNKIYLIFLISCFLFYPFVTKCSLSMINCIHLDDSKNTYLFLSPNILCWQGVHSKVFFIIGFLGILVWGLVFPVLLGVLIGKNIKKSKNSKSKDMSMSENNNVLMIKMSDSNNVLMIRSKKTNSKEDIDMKNSGTREGLMQHKEMFIFFYKDYRSQYYFWECIIFLQKFFLSLIPNLTELAGDENIDIIFISVMMLYTIFLIRSSPFRVLKLNNLELFSIVVTVCSRVLIVFLNSYYQNAYVLAICSMLLITLNVLFFLLAFFYLYKYNNWKAFFNRYKQKYKGMKDLMKTLPNSLSRLKGSVKDLKPVQKHISKSKFHK